METPEIVITTIPLTRITSAPDNYYNSNNIAHSDLPETLQALEPPCNRSTCYALSHFETRFSLWLPILTSLRVPQPSTPFPGGSIELSRSVCHTLRDAVKTGSMLGRVPEGEREDIEELLKPMLAPFFPAEENRKEDESKYRYETQKYEGLGEKPAYFIRLDSCSPKDGVYRMGPITSVSAAILTLCTSLRVYKAFRDTLLDDDKTLTERLHLLPWRADMQTGNEFRCFVPPDGTVRAVSQYTERDTRWSKDGKDKMEGVVKEILRCNERVRKTAAEMGVQMPSGGYSLDVHVVRDGDKWRAEPVELNSFGAQHASGSALFNWVDDWEVMYGRTEEVDVRIAEPDEQEVSK